MLTGLAVVAGALLLVLPRPFESSEVSEYAASSERARDGRPSLAVLPLANYSDREQDAYFTEGMHEELQTHLGRISALDVRSRTSTLRYRESEKDLREIGRELGARYVVEGGVLRAGDRVRINVQLIDALEDQHLWAEAFERAISVENLLAIQSEIATRIASAVKVEILPAERERLDAIPTYDLEAFDLYLLGRHYWNKRTKEGLERGADYFRQAIERDSTFALAYVGLADSYLMLWQHGFMSDADVVALARPAAEKAHQLDEGLAEAHASWGFLRLAEGDTLAAEREFREAIELAPGYAFGHYWYAWLLSLRGRWDEAMGAIRVAVELDPLNPVIANGYATLLLGSGDLDAALVQVRRAVELDSSVAETYSTKAWILQLMGRSDEALAAARRAVDLDPLSPDFNRVLAQLLVQTRNYDEAIESYERTLELDPDPLFTYEAYALLLAALGRQADARRAIGRAIDLRPRSSQFNRDLGVVLYLGGDYAAAIQQLERSVGLSVGAADSARTYGYLGGAYVGAGRYREAIEALQTAIALAPEVQDHRVTLAYAWARSGERSRAIEILEGPRVNTADPAGVAAAYAALGEIDAAFEWLDRAFASGSVRLYALNVDPVYDPLRSDPRFSRLLGRMGLDRSPDSSPGGK